MRSLTLKERLFILWPDMSEVKTQTEKLGLTFKSISEGPRQQAQEAFDLATKYRSILILLHDDLLFHKEMATTGTEMGTDDIGIGRLVCHFLFGDSFNDLVATLWAMKHDINHGNTPLLDKLSK